MTITVCRIFFFIKNCNQLFFHKKAPTDLIDRSGLLFAIQVEICLSLRSGGNSFCNTGFFSCGIILVDISLGSSLIKSNLSFLNRYRYVCICKCDGGLRLLYHRANFTFLHLVRSRLLLCYLHTLDCGFNIRHFLHLHLVNQFRHQEILP